MEYTFSSCAWVAESSCTRGDAFKRGAERRRNGQTKILNICFNASLSDLTCHSIVSGVQLASLLFVYNCTLVKMSYTCYSFSLSAAIVAASCPGLIAEHWPSGSSTLSESLHCMLVEAQRRVVQLGGAVWDATAQRWRVGVLSWAEQLGEWTRKNYI